VVKGTVYFVEQGSPAGDEAWRSSVEVLRRLLPSAMTPDDPMPARNVVFRIHIDEMHGRASVGSPPSA
jgi:hypothetical protein